MGFGKDRQGGQRLLEEFGQRFGAKIVFVPARQIEGQKIGTSQIKLALESGDLSKVRSMLGRAFEISGSVRHGDHRGRKIGFPTANVHLTPRTLPPFGVYAVWASCEGKRYPGVANLGLRPTISPGAFVPRFEVHLLDGANHELYGKRLQVEFVTFIREERRFEGLEQLRVAIAADCQQALVELQQGIAV